jgi:exonuclease SbcC
LATAAGREEARAKREAASAAKLACEQRIETLRGAVAGHREALTRIEAMLAQCLATLSLEEAVARALLSVSSDEQQALRTQLDAADSALGIAHAAVAAREKDLSEAVGDGAPTQERDVLAARGAELDQSIDALAQRLGDICARLSADAAARERASALAKEIEDARKTATSWEEINAAIGSSNGDRFRRFAQGITLERLVALANQRLAALAPRYRLERASGEGGELGLHIVDRELFDEKRSTRSLSGGERFLASLALALALASLEGRDSFVDTLFIDEGFGALDAATLDMAIDALEALHGQGRKVGVISHVESLHQRIATQIRVEKRGNGKSVVRIDERSAVRAF